jgi:hypothetical protein
MQGSAQNLVFEPFDDRDLGGGTVRGTVICESHELGQSDEQQTTAAVSGSRPLLTLKVIAGRSPSWSSER